MIRSKKPKHIISSHLIYNLNYITNLFKTIYLRQPQKIPAKLKPNQSVLWFIATGSEVRSCHMACGVIWVVSMWVIINYSWLFQWNCIGVDMATHVTVALGVCRQIHGIFYIFAVFINMKGWAGSCRCSCWCFLSWDNRAIIWGARGSAVIHLSCLLILTVLLDSGNEKYLLVPVFHVWCSTSHWAKLIMNILFALLTRLCTLYLK